MVRKFLQVSSLILLGAAVQGGFLSFYGVPLIWLLAYLGVTAFMFGLAWYLDWWIKPATARKWIYIAFITGMWFGFMLLNHVLTEEEFNLVDLLGLLFGTLVFGGGMWLCYRGDPLRKWGLTCQKENSSKDAD